MLEEQESTSQSQEERLAERVEDEGDRIDWSQKELAVSNRGGVPLGNQELSKEVAY